MLRFHVCPCCAGGDLITVDTGQALLKLLDVHLAYDVGFNPPHVQAELRNIYNAILNAQQGPRVPAIDPLLQ